MIQKKTKTAKMTSIHPESVDEVYEEARELEPPLAPDYLSMEHHYSQLMYIHEAAIQLVTARLNILKGEFRFCNDRNPISSISSRIKSKESLFEKMQRKGLPMTFEAMTTGIQDIAGVRVACPFIEDVYYVARMLCRQKIIELVEVKDYIRHPKPNGYRSLHLIIKVDVDLASKTLSVPVEVQIRTIAMDFWASTEHQLRYKKDRVFTEADHAKLKECADLMAQADYKMQEIAGAFDLESVDSW